MFPLTHVVNIRSLPPNWQSNPQYVYIGRAGHNHDSLFGNPYSIGKDGSREQVIRAHRLYFAEHLIHDPEFKRRVHDLRGKTLVCFCKPNACHGDAIAAYLNTISFLNIAASPKEDQP